jgi:branched-chain amino acid transport system substrate-binding protein
MPRLALSALAVVSALGLTACGKEEPKLAPTKETAKEEVVPREVVVKIGHAGPLTGGIAHLGKDNENGARLAIEQANAKGITIDGNPIKFELIAEDDEEKPAKGPIVAQKFADAKVAGVVGHLNSGVTIPASSVYDQAGIPMISGSATNPKLTEQGFKGVFRVVGRDDQQGPAIASYLVSEFNPKTVAVIDDATAYGEGLANEVEKALKGAGVNVLAREKGHKDTKDWKPILTKVRGRKPDAVFYGGMDATGGPLLRQGRELGLTSVFAFGDGACTDEMKKLAGDAQAEGLICSQAGLPVQAASKAFLDAYKGKFNTDPILYAPFTFDATNLLLAAMQKANSVEPAKYLPELAKISHDGSTGKIEFDDKGDRKDAEITIFTIRNGKLEPVAIVKSGKTTKFDDFMKAAEAAGAAALDAAKDVTGKAVDVAKDAAKDVAKGVSQTANRVARDATDAGKEIREAAGKALEGAKDLVKK